MGKPAVRVMLKNLKKSLPDIAEADMLGTKEDMRDFASAIKKIQLNS